MRRRRQAVGGLGCRGALGAQTGCAIRHACAAIGWPDALDAFRRSGVAHSAHALGAVFIAAARNDAGAIDANPVSRALQVDVALVALAVCATVRPAGLVGAVGVDHAALANTESEVTDVVAVAVRILDGALDASTVPAAGVMVITISIGLAGSSARCLRRAAGLHDAAYLPGEAVRCVAAGETATSDAMNRRGLAVLVAVAFAATEQGVARIGTTGAERVVRIAGLGATASFAAHPRRRGRGRRPGSARADTRSAASGLRR